MFGSSPNLPTYHSLIVKSAPWIFWHAPVWKTTLQYSSIAGPEIHPRCLPEHYPIKSHGWKTWAPWRRTSFAKLHRALQSALRPLTARPASVSGLDLKRRHPDVFCLLVFNEWGEKKMLSSPMPRKKTLQIAGNVMSNCAAWSWGAVEIRLAFRWDQSLHGRFILWYSSFLGGWSWLVNVQPVGNKTTKRTGCNCRHIRGYTG